MGLTFAKDKNRIANLERGTEELGDTRLSEPSSVAVSGS
jgi:hypothetical protein